MAYIGSYPEKLVPILNDLVSLIDSEVADTENPKVAKLETIKTLMNAFIQLDTTLSKNYSEGQISYDLNYKSPLADTGVLGVRVNLGQEVLNIFYNDTGDTIENGKVVSRNGTATTVGAVDIPNAALASNDNDSLSFNILGVCTSDVADGEIGFATCIGKVQGLDTSSFTFLGPLWLGTDGNVQASKPLFPANRVLLGGLEKIDPANGVYAIDRNTFPRTDVGKSYGFTSQGIPSGTYWKAGFYDWNSSDANLDEGSPSISYGDSGRAYAAHPAIVAGGPGVVVGGGQVRLVAIGIQDFEDGTPQQAGQTVVIAEDITTLVLDNYYEAAEKMSGNISFELEVVSGSPTAYSLDFNYGYAKYEDFQDRDITITEFECVWQGNANDSNFDVALYHHRQTGWTYAPTGFEPGNSVICRKSVDQPLAGDVDNNEDGAYKRTNLDFYVAGESAAEGIIIQVITGANNTIQTMDMHIGAVSEELKR